MNVGATGDPTLPANLQNLSALTINGDSGLSALDQYGTLTQSSDGSYTFNGNGQQVAPLILNDVNNLTIENSVFGNTGSGGAVTFNAGNNDAVINSTFSNIGYGVGEFQSGNVNPTNMAIVNNTFSDINGPWPAASAVEFDGAGASATTAVANGQNDVSHNTINDSSTNSALNGQDIISIYNYGDGGDNSQTLVSANQITGSYTPTDGSYTPDSAINDEMSNNVTIAGNFVTQQHNAGIGDNGSENIDVSGNLVTDSSISYFNGPENGINPTGQWTFNNSDQTAQVAVTSGQSAAGYPELYLPGGPTNDPGNTNNWDAGGAGDSTVAASPAAPSVSDNTPPATTTPPVESSTSTPAATITPSDTASSTAATSTPGTDSNGGAGTTNTGGTGSDNGTGTTNTGGTGSDGGTGTTNTIGTASDGGTGVTNAGGTGSDTGNYSVVNGTIIGPNGQPFDGKGLAVYAPQLSQSQAAAIMQEMPGLNFIRLTSIPATDSPADIQADIQDFQSINPNVVVEVEDHTYMGSTDTPLEGAALTTEENWYSQIAAANVNNPNVWFGTANEPNDSSDEQEVVNQEVGIYNAIRGAGSNNMVMLEADGGGTFGPQQADPSAYAAMNNVAWDIHFYGGVTNGDTSVSDNVSAIQSEAGGANGITESNGSGGQQNIPVIVGEYGDSINGQNLDSNGTAAVDAVQTANNQGLVQGAVAWVWDGNYNPNDAITLDGTPSTITPYGQELINYVNNGSTGSVT
jgi:Cellulase (glycosyl hydrolase family 5)